MTEITKPNLSGVAETLLITLYIRATESQRPDALIKDERAEAIVRQLDPESLQKTLTLTDDFSRVAVILKTREFDRFVQDFLARQPDAVVVHIGCGLDTRFERVDNGRVEWFDLDLPDVIDLRRKVIGGEGARYHLLAGSVLESAWWDRVRVHKDRPFLFLAEGVFMYFTEAQVKGLVLGLLENFPGAELVFDAFSPVMRWAHNVKVTRTGVGAYLHWGLKQGRELERWSEPGAGGIRLLDERYPFQYSVPRMRRALKMRLFPFLKTAICVYHYQFC
ncbi:O-Methyltransferase [Longilinea arvoryzae]|uniref:O-Methyltransferase n=1 Tax=Longilinea arvoryzae TaxID=360412 RepID=A0A0S7B732_9CHLR|nr:class I SAM-dependent methyltransferase [Longilinea arvoryzae]GAP13116.1 O-Methyltransferase [Longilinea arvoryzae]